MRHVFCQITNAQYCEEERKGVGGSEWQSVRAVGTFTQGHEGRPHGEGDLGAQRQVDHRLQQI